MPLSICIHPVSQKQDKRRSIVINGSQRISRVDAKLFIIHEKGGAIEDILWLKQGREADLKKMYPLEGTDPIVQMHERDKE